MRYSLIGLAVAVLLGVRGDAVAESVPCGECGASTFPDAAVYLESQGYRQDEYRVLLTWVEAARTHEPCLVRGYHVLRLHDREAFDVYSDCAGDLLSAEEVLGLGIGPKSWDPKPVEASMEL
ncbi:MAG TPA: hypothetical protein ENN80_04885, partial [Candidatus Hydrogenedentes bacterium]|nr:hypothetical protein [Candidatus Hydrogenedentota bacterium]